MNDVVGYMHKDTWMKRGDKFCIEIVRWSNANSSENTWNIYAYIYPEHSLFQQLTDDSIFGGNVINNFNCGCTFSQWYRNSYGKVTVKQYGCDYGHIDDDESLLKATTPEQASEVFSDADKLFKELSN